MYESRTTQLLPPKLTPVTAPQPAIPPSFHALPRRALVLTVAELMISLLLAALDQTIVGTAMPRRATARPQRRW
jgi:hypothetical protein